mmetsp:Transcript_612/g.1418  ORF Transcript_612/g.1418 Transcript_612/m.1418 type:complete len:242 (+) Transcript_612:261-986(+)
MGDTNTFESAYSDSERGNGYRFPANNVMVGAVSTVSTPLGKEDPAAAVSLISVPPSSPACSTTSATEYPTCILSPADVTHRRVPGAGARASSGSDRTAIVDPSGEIVATERETGFEGAVAWKATWRGASPGSSIVAVPPMPPGGKGYTPSGTWIESEDPSGAEDATGKKSSARSAGEANGVTRSPGWRIAGKGIDACAVNSSAPPRVAVTASSGKCCPGDATSWSTLPFAASSRDVREAAR